MANRKKSIEIEEGLEKEFKEDEKETKSEYEESEENENIETEDEENEKSEVEEEAEEKEKETEEDEEKKQVFVHDVSDFGNRGSLESEVEETGEGEEGRNEEGFEQFTPQMSVREIPASTLVSAPSSSIEEEVRGISETSSSKERREQAARTPVADYVAGSYERNYWVGGEQRRTEPRDIEMGIIQAIPRKDIREIVDTDSAKRVDFSAWQRGMEARDMRFRREASPTEEEYVIDVRKVSEETRLPFERKEKKREYRP